MSNEFGSYYDGTAERMVSLPRHQRVRAQVRGYRGKDVPVTNIVIDGIIIGYVCESDGYVHGSGVAHCYRATVCNVDRMTHEVILSAQRAVTD